MSTTIKRVALVAVAALGLGVLSVAPSQAVTNADSLTLSAATAAQTTAETATATSATAKISFLAGVSTDSLTVTASLVSGPATSTALPYLQLVETSTAEVKGAALGTALAKSDSITPNSAAVVLPLTGATLPAVVSATFKVYLGKGASTTAPSVAGTYVVKLTPAIGAGGGALASTAQTITITVSADTNLDTVASAANTSSIISAGDTWTATTDATVFASKSAAASAGPVAVVTLIQANAAGKTLYTSPASAGESLTVTVAGPGSITAVESRTTQSTTGLTSVSGARALTLKNGQQVAIFADGSAGVTTLTFTNSAGTVISTESLTFYSTVAAKVVATVKKAYVKAGGAATDGNTAADKTQTNSRVFYVKVYDADGRDMGNAITPTVKPTSATTDALIGAAGTCTYLATKTTTQEVGFYCSAPGVSSTKFGKVNYTFTATNADLTTATTTADVTFSDVVAKKITVTGQATGAIGDKITVTFTATDKNGYPVADASYDGNASLTQGAIWDSVVNTSSSFAPFAAGETITTVSGVATRSVYLPIAGGTVASTWTLTGTAGTASGAVSADLAATTITYSVAVTNAGVDAATDAANEATDAANAATDAALAAADAADAATAAAQDASDAVAALSATVAKLVASLKAQITTLTNLVIKIQKKVKA